MTTLGLGLCAYVAAGVVAVGTVESDCVCKSALVTNMTWTLGPVKIKGHDVAAVMIDRKTAKIQIGVSLVWVREGDEDEACKGPPTS